MARPVPLGPPFIVVATQNPYEFEGTYPLPESQLDRFLLRCASAIPTGPPRKTCLPSIVWANRSNRWSRC